MRRPVVLAALGIIAAVLAAGAQATAGRARPRLRLKAQLPALARFGGSVRSATSLLLAEHNDLVGALVGGEVGKPIAPIDLPAAPNAGDAPPAAPPAPAAP